MRVMVLVKLPTTAKRAFSPTEALEALEVMGRYNEELVNVGIMLVSDGLKPSSRGKQRPLRISTERGTSPHGLGL
jgi:hypothetical protein